MAGLNDRGQLLLAGAFVLAVALIGLTLVLTSGGYTTTLASQDNAVERGTDAVTVRESVVSDLDHHLERANSKYGSLSDRESAFRAVVPAVGSGVRNQSAQRGRLVELSDSAFENGGKCIEPPEQGIHLFKPRLGGRVGGILVGADSGIRPQTATTASEVIVFFE